MKLDVESLEADAFALANEERRVGEALSNFEAALNERQVRTSAEIRLPPGITKSTGVSELCWNGSCNGPWGLEVIAEGARGTYSLHVEDLEVRRAALALLPRLLEVIAENQRGRRQKLGV